MKKIGLILPVALFILAAALPVLAQSGCVDSPENPTLVLGLIASAAGIGFVQVRNRLQSRKRSRSRDR